jgi:hypothetical protein
MTILELFLYSLYSLSSTPLAPFVRQGYLFTYTTADYWTSAFGAPAEAPSFLVFISDFIQNYLIHYSVALSVDDSVLQEMSFYFDIANQILTVHYDHDVDPADAVFEYGYVEGFTDEDVIYIDDIEYEPLIKSIPSLAQQADLNAYDKQAMMTGSAALMNTGGKLDYLIGTSLHGNGVRVSYLETVPGVSNYTRADVVGLQKFYIEEFKWSLSELNLDLQDIRKAQEVNICTDVFDKTTYPFLDDGDAGKEIPLAYGLIRCSEALCTNKIINSGPVEYRQALELVSLGTVKVKKDDVWNVVFPTAVDLATGSFTIAGADARSTNGDAYDCKVDGSFGIANATIADIIVDLNLRYAGIVFTASNYDIAEWAAESAALTTGGWLFKKKTPLYKAIAILQAGAVAGFRYEINNGLRTIRIDDWTRANVARISREELSGQLAFSITFDPKNIAGIIDVKYAKDFEADSFLTETNNDNQGYAIQNFRDLGNKSIPIETVLTAQADAAARALWSSTRYAELRGVFSDSLRGLTHLWRRIYDCIEIEITPAMFDADTATYLAGREYFGVWKVQILSVNPSVKMKTNQITARLVAKVA